MRTITLAELDTELLRLDEALSRSDDELRKGFGTFQLSPENNIPSDPYSEAYYRHQMDVYCRIAAVDSYSIANERTIIPSIEDATRVPFPYYTHSAQTVGDQLLAIGFIIKTMNLSPGARILEFGPGWGNTTINFARMGYAVTAVDVEPNFVQLINARASMIGCPVRTILGSFGPVPDTQERFDAVVFFECFHHCEDHLKLIGQLGDMVSPDGVIVFASEPIVEEFHVPWGVRLDGMALWGIRRFKWMELGFKESYFVRTMMRAGWVVSKHVCNNTPLGVIFLARRHAGSYNLGDLMMPRDEEQTWAPPETTAGMGLRYSAGSSVLTVDQDTQWRSASVDVLNVASFPLEVTVHCNADARTTVCVGPGKEAALTVDLTGADRRLVISSPSWCPKDLGINADGRTLGVAVRVVRLNR